MEFKLETFHRNVSNKTLIDDLRHVSNVLGKRTVTKSEYDKHGIYHSTTLHRRFGSWFGALDQAGLKRTRNLGVADEEYFQNIEQIWRLLGHQPRYFEICKPLSKYSAGAYAYRFGSWRKALKAFIKFINNKVDEENEKISSEELSKSNTCQKKISEKSDINIVVHKTSRKPSWKLRFLVMHRDNFKCQQCGKSPALHHGVVLHIDHKIPWSKGGETEMNNLQTLCEQCNIGKSDLSLSGGDNDVYMSS
ncbi:MAG: HNH endonuclease [Sedimentisphaerales bacterium]|nr:HNH endonuclease [Sedimentisphaerales bacterium]